MNGNSPKVVLSKMTATVTGNIIFCILQLPLISDGRRSVAMADGQNATRPSLHFHVTTVQPISNANESVCDDPHCLYIPSILCLTIVPVCFIVFGLGLMVLLCRQHKHLRQLLTSCTQKEKLITRHQSLASESPAHDLSFLDDHSTCVQVGSLMSEASMSTNALSPTNFFPHFNTPASTSCSSDVSRTTPVGGSTGHTHTWGAFVRWDDHLESPPHVGNPRLNTDSTSSTFQSATSVEMEWDNFLPDSNAFHGRNNRRIPLLRDLEYWV